MPNKLKEKYKTHNTEVLIHELLNHYAKWLVDNGYADTDQICEEPLAVDEYLKENPSIKFLDKHKEENNKNWEVAIKYNCDEETTQRILNAKKGLDV